MQETRPDQQQEAPLEDIELYEAPTVIDLPGPDPSAAADTTKALTPAQNGKPAIGGKKKSSSATVLPYRRRRAGLPTPLLILVVALVALLIVSGLGLIAFAETTQYRTTLRDATAAANNAARSIQRTAQAAQNGTSSALNTAQANIEASATSQADGQAQATANIDDATATAQALSDFYTQATDGNPVFDDPLSDNTGAGQWDEGSPSTGTGCQFTDSGYHALEAQNNYLQPCLAQSTRFSSFAYQVHVNIQKDSQGSAGLLFRVGNSDNAYYFFHISPDGSYALDLYSSPDQGQTLTQGTSNAIVTGLNQDNLLTAIANSTSLYLYANGQYLTTVTDSRLSAGKIGLGVVSKNGSIDAMFNDAQVWNLNAQQTPGETPTPGYAQTPSTDGTTTPDPTVSPTATDTNTTP